MIQPQNFDALHDRLLEMAKQLSDTLRPQIESRRDVAKTLVSLSSAALLFSITFASSLIKPNSSSLLRYAIGGCWLAFLLSLILSLLSLWFSVGLISFEALLITKTEEINKIALEGFDTLPDFVAQLWEREIVPDDKRSRRSLLAAFITYGIALAIFLLVGVWQFIL